MDALTQKLIGLRDRFARLKWDEQAHPRADDGKFGEGGGGGGESKPAAQAPHATAAEADAWGAKNVVTEGGVKPSERDALIHYQASSGNYKYMNAELRTGVPDSDPRHGRAIKEIDAVMARSTVKAPVIVLRGIPAKVAAKLNLKVGESYQDKGFCSTTANQTTANKFSASGALEGTLCEIHVPAGTHAVYLHSMSESELLLDRGARFEVTEVSHGGRRVKMTLIPKGTARPGSPQPRITSSLHGATIKQQEDEDAGDPGRFSWGEGDLEPASDEEEMGTEEPAPDRTPRTVVPWEGDTLARKLLHLRDRFVRLKGDWSEGDHPRADDGTFGEGGAGGDVAEEAPHEQASREWGERAEERDDRREYLEETRTTVDDWEETNRQGIESVDAAGEGVKTGAYDHDDFRAAINEHLAATVTQLHDIQNSLHTIGADADDLEAFDSLVAAGKKDLLAAALAYSGTAKKTAAAAASLATLTDTEPELPDEPPAADSENLPPEPDADEYDDGEDDEAYQAAQEEYESATAAHEAAEKAHDDWENECAATLEQHAAAVEDAQAALDELGEALDGHAARFDEAVTGLIAAAQETAAAILDGARDDLGAADTADPEPARKPATVTPLQGDTLAGKLLHLRDRFIRLKGDFREGDHPRADDGKFGSGGGGEDDDAAAEQAAADKDAAQERRATIQSARDDLFAAIGENDLENSLADRVAEAGATWNGWSDQDGTHHEGLLVSHDEYDGIASVDRQAAAAQLKDDFEAAKALTAEVADKADQALADLGERGILTEAETAELQTVRDSLVSRLEKRQKKLGKDSEAVMKAVDRWEKTSDPGDYDESDPVSVSRHEAWGKASADLIAAADRQQLSLSNLSDAADFGKLLGKADRMLRVHQSAVLAKSIASLRDRFRKLLKGDWSEGDHPRADDGEFGSGGGKKPTGKKPDVWPAAGKLSLPSTFEEAAALATSLREALETVAPGKVDREGMCAATSQALAQALPGAEVHAGTLRLPDGSTDAHAIVRVGNYWIDVTADQYGGGDGGRIRVYEELPAEYEGFEKVNGRDLLDSRERAKADEIAGALKNSTRAKLLRLRDRLQDRP